MNIMNTVPKVPNCGLHPACPPPAHSHWDCGFSPQLQRPSAYGPQRPMGRATWLRCSGHWGFDISFSGSWRGCELPPHPVRAVLPGPLENREPSKSMPCSWLGIIFFWWKQVRSNTWDILRWRMMEGNVEEAATPREEAGKKHGTANETIRTAFVHSLSSIFPENHSTLPCAKTQEIVSQTQEQCPPAVLPKNGRHMWQFYHPLQKKQTRPKPKGKPSPITYVEMGGGEKKQLKVYVWGYHVTTLYISPKRHLGLTHKSIIHNAKRNGQIVWYPFKTPHVHVTSYSIGPS